MTNLKQDLARYGELKEIDKNIEARMAELDVLIQIERKEEYGNEYYQLIKDSGNIKAAGIEIYNSFAHAMQLITVMQEALRKSDNELEHIYRHYLDINHTCVARDLIANALSQAAKMGVE